MIDFIKALFSESPDVSSIRFMAISALLIGGAVAFLGIYLNKDLNQVSFLAAVFVTAAFGGKVGQKIFESKEKKD
jgi:uncharacterized membrane protein YiaA